MKQHQSKLLYTFTDEAPALATFSFLPIIRAFAESSEITVELKDISLAARIIATFPESLTAEQRQPDCLSELGEIAKTPGANIIKLPNISASIPQLTACIAELQGNGFNVPNFPAEPKNAEEEAVKARYKKVLGSAVNPVLREGNSDRRVAGPVKTFAQKNPHSMGAWSPTSKTKVCHMNDKDFYSSERSTVVPAATTVRIEHVAASGEVTVLKEKTDLQSGEVIDGSVMNCAALRAFMEDTLQEAKRDGVLLSLHLKATMMKVSDPIIFGHCVSVFFKAAFEKHADLFARIGVSPNNGLGDLFGRLADLPAAERAAVEADMEACYADRPELAMVDSDRGITNLHVPSDVIIDASMPAAIRTSGQMWGKDGQLHDSYMIIPDRSYAGLYQETVDFCRTNGQFDVSTMGNVSNVGLMAQKAEEYGSHDKTFEIAGPGKVRVVDTAGATLLEHDVETGDIWRMCQTRDAPIRDWIKLAVSRARATGDPALFWLDPARAHDTVLIGKVDEYLKLHDTTGLDIRVLSTREAARVSLQRAKDGQNTISVTGNVLRDYLTDLFPILELGTSAKMLSIVPLLAGGGLFETGAGGSAPKHVQQFVKEGHLRWDSLGEFLALAVSLEDVGNKTSNTKALILGKALNDATARFLEENKSPSRKVNELDVRGSHYYLAAFWAQCLATQTECPALAKVFEPFAAKLQEAEEAIISELNAAQGAPVDIGGYFLPSTAKAERAMRPSPTLNKIIDELLAASLLVSRL